MTPLIPGTLLAVAAVSYVLYPMLMSERPSESPLVEDADAGIRDNARTQAMDALTDIEFDRATGKLSDSDYESLKTWYAEQALTAPREKIACEKCGPRPDPDARFCSRCGRPL